MKNVKEILAAKRRKLSATHSEVEEHRHHHEHHGNTQTETRYQCPMKCEGEKTYNEPGDCPICNMHLAPVE